MAADLVDREVLQRAFERGLRAPGRADADRVGDAAMIDADALHQQHDALDFVGRDLALVRAAERARDRAAHLDRLRMRGFDDGPEALDAFLDACS